MPMRKRFLVIGTIALVALMLIFIGPGLLTAEGPSPRELALPGSSLVAHSNDLEALRALIHSRGLSELIESLGPDSAEDRALWHRPLRKDAGPDPRHPAFWLQGELAISVVAQPPESELPAHQRNPDPRRPWPFRRLRLAWRPEGLLRRSMLSWGSQAWFWRRALAEPRWTRAGVRFVGEGLIVERPSLLLDPETQRARRPLPPLLVERRGSTMVATLGDSVPGPIGSSIPEPELKLTLPEPAPFALVASSPWSLQLGQALRGLLDEVSGSVVATLLAPRQREPLVVRVPQSGEVFASLEFACDLPLSSLPRPRLAEGDLATARATMSTAAILRVLADAPSSDPQLKPVEDLETARGACGSATGAFSAAREQLEDLIRSHAGLESLEKSPLILRLSARGSPNELTPGFAIASPAGGDLDLETLTRQLRSLHRAARGQTEPSSERRSLLIEARQGWLWLASDAQFLRENEAQGEQKEASLRASVSPIALRQFALDRRQPRVERAALIPAQELIDLAEQLRRDFAYALKRKPEDEDPELDAMVEDRLRRHLRFRAQQAQKESRARLDRLAGLKLEGLSEMMLDLVEAGAGRRRLEIRLR